MYYKKMERKGETGFMLLIIHRRKQVKEIKDERMSRRRK